MDYNTAVEYTHSLLRFGSRPGLSRITALLEALSNPQKKLSAVHVAGTNGKGSVCACLSAIFEKKGLKTGLFISPFITDFRERMQINSKFISKVDYAAAASRVREAAESLPAELFPTEFEFVTAAAVLWFAEKGCDIVVLETGLGGRLDSTNVLEKPLCTVITSISTDHTAVLGDTIDKIAAEKCGIIKENCPLVTTALQPTAAAEVIKRTAEEKDAPLYAVDPTKAEILFDGLSGSDFIFEGMNIHQPLAGEFQVENTCLAVRAAKLAVGSLTEDDIIEGLKNVRHPARFEIMSKSPLIILDGAHNDGGAKALAESLKKYLPSGHLFGICGMLKDKEYEKALSHLTPLFDEIMTVTPESPRALPAEELAKSLEGKVKKVCAEKTDEGLLRRAIEAAAGRPLIIFGSLYLAGQMYKYFE